jgi:starch phosphorylase
MTRGERINADKNGYLFKIELPAKRKISDYTPRVVPLFNSEVKPIETNQILWKK